MSNQIFRNLHEGPDILLLPNAWDAGSARLIESLGAKAIATTSAGLAWSRGYPDGDTLPLEQLFAATREIAEGHPSAAHRRHRRRLFGRSGRCGAGCR